MTTRRETPPRRRTDRAGRERAGAAGRERAAAPRRDPRPKRPARSGPRTTPTRRQAPAASTSQAKARAKARKAKAPRAVRAPLRERLIARVMSMDLRPQVLATKVPFVVLVIGSLAAGLGLTLWLSTDSAERSYQLGTARETDRVLNQQKESLERQVLEAQAAPALAEAARNLGMIPSQDTAHLVQDPAGNWVVVGDPKPAAGTSPPPLNTKLPDPTPPPPPPVPVNRTEVPVILPSPQRLALAPGATPMDSTLPPDANPEVLVRAPAAAPAQPAPPPAGEPIVPTGPLPGPQPGAPSPPDAPQPVNPLPTAPPA